jgi:hypothetical protein
MRLFIWTDLDDHPISSGRRWGYILWLPSYIYIVYTCFLWFTVLKDGDFPWGSVKLPENIQRNMWIQGYLLLGPARIAILASDFFAFQKRLKTRCQGRLSAPWSHQAFSALRTGRPGSCNDSNGHQWAIRWPTMVQPKGNTYWKILEVKGDLECTRLVPSQICEVFMTSYYFLALPFDQTSTCYSMTNLLMQ